ncbi:MAG TPA: hypothetical protein DCG06_01640 [Deltaproteobacteria bacterium]|nr:hypothetical protein [Deltaproteobacteria bacterium]
MRRWSTSNASDCSIQPRCCLLSRAIAESELAAATDLDTGHLNRIKNGRVVPNVATALRLAHALGLSVEDVSEWKPD